MLKKMFAATTALIMIFSSFAVSYAEEAAEKQYIVRLKTSDVQLMNADGSRHFFDIADESICIVQGNRKYQARFGSVLILILCFLAVGIGLQMFHSEIRVDFMCVAIGNLMLYNYRGNVIHQIDMTTRLLNRRCYEKNIENMKTSAYVLILILTNSNK